METSVDILSRLVEHYLSANLYDTARFYAERLYYENPTPQTLYRLANCYFREGKMNQTCLILQDSEWTENRYLYAHACFAIGKFSDAEKALVPSQNFSPKDLTQETIMKVPGGAAGLYLLGNICRREHRTEAAIEYFKYSLKLDATCWSAHTALCELGVIYPLTELYDMDIQTAINILHPTSNIHHKHLTSLSTQHTTLTNKQNLENIDNSNVQKNLIRKKIVEASVDVSSCPKPSAALGLSSSCLHIPFVSPGSNCNNTNNNNNNHNNNNNSGLQSTSFPSSHRNTNKDSSAAAIESNSIDYIYPALSPYTAPREPAYLAFDFDTPGLTPIGNDCDDTQNHIHTHTTGGKTMFMSTLGYLDDHEHEHEHDNIVHDDHDIGDMSAVDISSSNLNFKMSMMNTAKSTDIGSTSALSSSTFLEDSMHHNTSSSHMLPSQLRMMDMYNRRAPGGGGGGRRVSFDPSGRLSFSGVANDSGYNTNMNSMPGKGIVNTDHEHPHQQHLLTGQSHSDLGSDDMKDDECEETSHPQKIQRRSTAVRASSSSSSSVGGPGGRSPPPPPIGTGITRRMSTRSRLSGGGGRDSTGAAAAAASSSTTATHGTTDKVKSQKLQRPGSGSVSVSRDISDYSQSQSSSITKRLSKSHETSHKTTNTGSGLGLGVGRTTSDTQHESNTIARTQSQSQSRRSVSVHATTTATSSNSTKTEGVGRGGGDTMPSQSSSSSSVTVSGAKSTFALLTVLARVSQLQHSCRGEDCISMLQNIPRRHLLSGWVQETIGRALLERADYNGVLIALREMMRLEPFRIRGVETLSTALWQLKKDKELCALAQQVVEIDKFSPEAWCVVGNCFSLQREHETALKFFGRALQVDPYFAYAYTLSGHEHVLNEDLEKASLSFRSALRIDPRHYNAWYGLGSVYHRKEQFELAEFHFRRAVEINPSSSVLQCYLGMVLLARGCTDDALCVLQDACAVDRKNPQVVGSCSLSSRYIIEASPQIAQALIITGQLAAAREALLVVRDMAPREPPVHARLGQVCLRLGRLKEALEHLDTAVMLDSKEAVALKAVLLQQIEERRNDDASSSDLDNINQDYIGEDYDE
eukprot:gene7385-15078_t